MATSTTTKETTEPHEIASDKDELVCSPTPSLMQYSRVDSTDSLCVTISSLPAGKLDHDQFSATDSDNPNHNVDDNSTLVIICNSFTPRQSQFIQPPSVKSMNNIKVQHHKARRSMSISSHGSESNLVDDHDLLFNDELYYEKQELATEISSQGCDPVEHFNYGSLNDTESQEIRSAARPYYHNDEKFVNVSLVSPSERLLLIPPKRHYTSQARWKQPKYRWSTILLLSMMVIVSVTTMTSLYETGKLAHGYKNDTGILALPNDNVYISFDDTRSLVYSRKLTLSSYPAFSNSSDQQSYDTDLYRLNRNELMSSVSIKALDFNQNETFFDQCSNYPGKCILKDFLYLAENAPSTVLDFIINVNNFIPGETIIRLIVFDNFKLFHEYLTTDNYLTAIKTELMTSNNYQFTFTNNDVKRSGYYFFAIENIEGDAQWFTAHLSGNQSYYNISTSSLTPYCTLNNSTEYRCTMDSLDHDNHIIGHVRTGRPAISYTTDLYNQQQLFEILLEVSDPIPTTNGQLIVVGTASFLSLILFTCCFFCFCCFHCHNRRRKKFYTV